jgi:CheY-like chemotaxis protein
MVYAKEQEVFEAVINLVKNAAEALPGGGMIRVSTALEDREAVLRIEDNGVGIAEHHLQRIFEPFFTTKGFQTAGMGLASTYGAISAMGGAISVDSQQGNGSRFEVRLPAFGAHQSEPQQACPLCRESLSILVIDDLPEVMDFIAKGLARHGHKVFPCRSGVESLEVFRSNSIDVVVCDLGMPRMSGEQVSERIQELARDKGVTRPPFILLTGWGEQAATGNKAASTTIDHVLAKPVDTDELLTAIGRLTARRNDHFRDVPEPPVQ